MAEDHVPWTADPAGIYFSDRFGVAPQILEEWGAFDISVVTDLPVFIDPFLLFNSEKEEYRALHEQIVEYLRFLRDHADEPLTDGRIKSWYTFSEVRQNWLGFTANGNAGHGLGKKFAVALHDALGGLLRNVGNESITESSHIEKLALVSRGAGRDTISDLTTNLIKHFLLRYSSDFALKHLPPQHRKRIPIARAKFNYNTETWAAQVYELPFTNGDFVILTPLDLLTKDDTWINRTDMERSFDTVLEAVDDAQLREDVNRYLGQRLTRKSSEKEQREARSLALRHFPDLVDCYIKLKEDTGDEAVARSREKVHDTQALLRDQVQKTAHDIARKTDFYEKPWSSTDEARRAVETFKHYIEDKDGWRLLNKGDSKGLSSEQDVQLFFGLLLQASRFDVNREVNNGRGPVDFKLSAGLDKSLIEFKLAKSSSLKRNMANQVDVYKAANDTDSAVFVVIAYSAKEIARTEEAISDLGLNTPGTMEVVIIDASPKDSASKI
ncbi:hypothetical protein [Pseudoclavibacter helvolus]|uniref:hypothetical protein n=1 Tax=Pseudoclavibacter helvolus TaxID=255205 RepID=UPI000AE6BF3C|nr:hypothetical protein [Pseudoclavibacter helvolus]